MNIRMVCRGLVALVLLALGLLCWSIGVKRYFEAALLLADIASAGPSQPAEKTSPAVVRRCLVFEHEGRVRRADLYRPAGAVRAGLVLLPGVAEQGTDDPRLVAFARALARARFAVLIPELAGLRRLQVAAVDALEVRDAFAWLAGRSDLVPSGRVGLAAFSYAVGPALLAASDAEIRDRVAFVFAVGGYYDLRRVLAYFTTGRYGFDGRGNFPPPAPYGLYAFVAGNLERLGDPHDRRLLTEATRRLRENPAARVDDLVAQLHDQGRALWAFVVNRDPQRVAALLAALPEAIRREIAALDLSRHDLGKLHAPLILVHGYADAMIPYPESIALARALPAGQTRLYLVRGLQHVDVAPGLPDRWRMLLALRDLLAAADGKLPR